MTDPASAIQREAQQLIDTQIATLRRSFLSDLDLVEYRDRANRIKTLFFQLDQIQSSRVPKLRERKARLRRAFTSQAAQMLLGVTQCVWRYDSACPNAS